MKKGLECPHCGYVQKKFAITCGKCRMPLIPKTLREYSDTLEKTMEGSDMSLDRKLDSRRRIRQIFDMAFGVYIKEEINKTDTWRDIQWGQLWSHFTHEVKEIHDSKGRDRQFHNILDAINLLGMLGAKIVLEEETKEKRKIEF